MKPVTYTSSLRVKKAQFVSYFRPGFAKGMLLGSWTLIVVGLAIYLFLQVRPVSLFVGLGLVGLMFSLWLRWDLSNNPTVYNQDIAEIALDSVVSNDIVFMPIYNRPGGALANIGIPLPMSSLGLSKYSDASSNQLHRRAQLRRAAVEICGGCSNISVPSQSLQNVYRSPLVGQRR